tara:strand:+ start:5876 stop:6475 length:600 start_codon:yes stop_codon:yes gene_type:complete
MSNIFIISAPSGCGKTTLVRELCNSYSFLEQTISHTTREIRASESDGEDYIFTDKQDFLTKIKNKEFIEYQNVYGNLYGTSRFSIKKIMDAGKDAILEIDYKGMLAIKNTIPSAISIYILPPSILELKTRLESRAMDSDKVIANRVSQASRELSYSKFSDYIIVNDQFNVAASSLKAIILHTKLQSNRSISSLNISFDS